MGGNAHVSVGELLLTQTMVKSEHLPLVDLGIQSKNLQNFAFFLLQQQTFSFIIAVRISSVNCPRWWDRVHSRFTVFRA